MRHCIIFNLITFLLFTQSIFAQTPQHRSCATTEVMAEQIRQNPDLIDNIEAIENHTQRFIKTPQIQTRNATITIPVVIHIIYRTANDIENISDAQILSQLETLNNDYRHLNSDQTNTPSVFQPFATDCGIEFKLAKRTPDGKSTTGIVRYPTTRRTPWGKNDEIKMPEKGGVAPWDASKYLNIYVCAIGSGILGYSTMPGTIASLDGVVIDYRYFGAIGNVVAPFNRGRTATHEIGHWLNLRHIWGDTDCGDDNVSDTPVQEGPNYGCVNFPHKSCGNQQSGDMFMNFMDYTDDACMNMFTQGQKQRIQALFGAGGSKASFLNSDALISPTETCLAPTNLNANNLSAKTATIKWTLSPSITNYIVEYRTLNSANWLTLNVKNMDNITILNLSSDKTYECRIKSVCTDTTSDYSSILTFKTLPIIEACTELYEPNNSFQTAKLIENNSVITTVIGTKVDNDFFVFKHTEAGKEIKVSLANLPFDYDVRLYNANRQLVGSSTKSNRADETIVLNDAPAGYYYVRIYPYKGFSSTQCYRLSVEILNENNNNARENLINDVANEKTIETLRVAPNPASDYTTVELETAFEGNAIIEILDLNGKKVVEKIQPVTKDITAFTLSVSNLKEGMYILTARCGDKIHNQKLIVNKLY